jgi:hypothetical protein
VRHFVAGLREGLAEGEAAADRPVPTRSIIQDSTLPE